MTDRPRCTFVKDDGTPCRTRGRINPANSRCIWHDPTRAEEVAEMRRKGGERSREVLREKLRENEIEERLPPLDSPHAAEVWLEEIGRAVAKELRSASWGQAMNSTVRAWLKAHEEGAIADQVDELKTTVAELKRKRKRERNGKP